MRKILFASLGIVMTAIILYSCRKNDTAIVTEDQASANLVKSESFIEFSTRFIPDFVSLANYHRQLKVQGKDREFINKVTIADNDETGLAEAYSSVSLDFGTVISLRNHVDNDILTLFHKNPFLLNFNEAQVRKIMVTALESGLFSDDPKWQKAKEEINLSLKTLQPHKTNIQRAMNGVGLNLASTDTGLTVDEVWGCVKQAVGAGGAGVLGIGGLQKLAQEGIQAAVVTLSKWLAKRAGWIGAAITLLDFADCVYKETID